MSSTIARLANGEVHDFDGLHSWMPIYGRPCSCHGRIVTLRIEAFTFPAWRRENPMGEETLEEKLKAIHADREAWEKRWKELGQHGTIDQGLALMTRQTQAYEAELGYATSAVKQLQDRQNGMVLVPLEADKARDAEVAALHLQIDTLLLQLDTLKAQIAASVHA